VTASKNSQPQPITKPVVEATPKAAAPVERPKEITSAPAGKVPEIAPPAPIKQEEVAVAKEPASPATAASLRLSMNIIGQRKETDGSYTEIVVSEGSVLRSGDNFQIHFDTNRPAYVAILMYDSRGKASQIYPESKTSQAGYVEPGKKLVVPSRDLWF